MIELFNSIIDMTEINVNAQEKSFLLCLLRHMNHTTGECYPSLETLQKKSGIKSKSTLLKVRQSLVDKNLISYRKKGTKLFYMITLTSTKSNQYKINEPVQKLNRTGTNFSTNWYNSRLQTINKQKNKQNKLITSTTGTNSDLLNFITSKDNPDYDYLHNFGWQYSELSSEFIC